MQLLLLFGAIIFFLVGVALIIGSFITSAVMKKNAAAAAATTTPPPAPVVPSVSATPPPPAAITPAAEAQPLEPTVVVPLARLDQFGALHVVHGILQGQTFTIPPEGFYIGRDGTMSQVVIPNDRVSKRHVWVGIRDGVVTAVDSGSTNGTFLNGSRTRLTQAPLSPGDVLTISDDVTRMEYRR